MQGPNVGAFLKEYVIYMDYQYINQRLIDLPSCYEWLLFHIYGGFFVIGKFSPNFDIKNIILTYTEDFSWKKWPKFVKFEILFFQITNFSNCQ
jgi:hypothetical protein